jgi:glucosamine--fructose-6-phosphate aminotransferase (isomerizing)
MCGIVGYTGSREAYPIVIKGLKRLEYRGYDSTGVALMNGGLKVYKKKGRVADLEDFIVGKDLHSHIGIGHTRWATHGEPSDRNAHPHTSASGKLAMIHNGIIENYAQIKKELVNKGYTFTSDTDSEVLLNFIEDIKKNNDCNMEEAVRVALKRITGAYCILLIDQDDPQTIIAARKGSPLVIGVGKGEHFLGSDASPMLEYTKEVVYVNDYELAIVRPDELILKNLGNEKITPFVTKLDMELAAIEKGGYEHFMLKEIFEQPQAFSSAIAPHVSLQEKSIHLKDCDLSQIVPNLDRILLVACGTSHYAGLVGKYFIERVAQIPCEVDFSSEFRYRRPILNSRMLMVTISQSGETADTLAAIRLAKASGVKTLSICNVKNSTIDREADFKLYMNSGPEIGVASTKAFVSSLGLLSCLALQLAQLRKSIRAEEIKQSVEALLSTPSLIEQVLNLDKYFLSAAEELKKFKGFLYLGRGVSFPISLEGALKMKELAYVHAEGYAAGEMKHGPLALIDDRMAIVTVIPKDEHFEKTLSNLEEAKARGGKIISIGSGDNPKVAKISDKYLGIPVAHWMSNPALAVIPLQLMAYHLARSLGHDVDQPRNLAKSVTVE